MIKKNKQNNTNSVLSRLSKNVVYSLYLAGFFSKKLSKNEIGVDEIIIGIVTNPYSIIKKMIDAIGFDRKKILEKYIEYINEGISFNDELISEVEKLDFSEQVKEVLIYSYQISKSMGHVYVGTEHIFLACLRVKTQLTDKLKVLGLNEKSVRRLVLDFGSYPKGLLTDTDEQKGDVSPVLSMFGYDLVNLAEKNLLDPIIGRDKEIESIINVLSRRKKNNPLIVGEPGVGKTSLIEGLAQRVVQKLVPASLRDIKIIKIDVNKIIAGSTMRGEVEEKMMAILKAASDDPSIILFFDDIHNLLGLGSAPGSGTDVTGILKPELTNGKLRCIGVTSTSGYKTIFEDDAAFNRRFQPIIIPELTIDQTINVLKRISTILEKYHRVDITNDAIKSAVLLSKRYINDRNLPDKAIDLLDEACARVRVNVEYAMNLGKIESEYDELVKNKENAVKKGDLEKAQKLRVIQEEIKNKIDELSEKKEKLLKKSKLVTEELVRTVISEWTSIPISTMSTGETSLLKRLDKVLSNRVVGQSEACEKVASAIKRGRTGISDEDRPWSSFLFLGPTGVGKSELAKVLAREMFGDEDALIQIDMSEMMEMHSVSKLIGSPPGYIGYKEGGQLTEKVRNNPFSVVLFDETEKAHEDVLNILLQILEYGHLTDGRGLKVSFKNTIIILTSNVGVDQLKTGATVGFKAIEDKIKEWDYEVIKKKLLSELKGYLKPELLNRLDEVIVFKPLFTKDISKIIDIMIAEFNERISEMKLKVEIDNKVKKLLLKEGFDQEYGARPLRRAIQKNIENVVADYLISNNFKRDKVTTIDLTVSHNQVSISD